MLCRAMLCLAVLSVFAWCAEGLQDVQQEGEAGLNASCPGMAEEISVPCCWGCAEWCGQEP